MTKPITKFDDAVEIYFESGSALILFREGIGFKSHLENKDDTHNELIQKDTNMYILSPHL